MLRHVVNQASAALLGAGVWGTLFVKSTGSFAMGVIAGWFAFRSEGGGPAGAFAQEYTVTRNAFSDNKLYGYGKTSPCHRLDSDCTVK